MIDGLSQERFEDLLDEGQLVNIESMINQGLYVKNGIVSFPSMTGYCFYPFLTGVDAAQSGILGLRWLDRQKENEHFRNYVGRTNVHMNEDLRKDVRTIFEHLETNDYSASINSYCNRGVIESVKTGLAHVTSKYDTYNAFGQIEKLPLIGSKLFKDIYEFEEQVRELASEQLKKNPKVHWVTFASPDARNHVHGTDEIYDDLIINLDRIIGSYVDEANILGHYRLFAIISDHGVRDVHTNLRVEKTLYDKTGIKLHRGKAANMLSMSLEEDADTYKDYDGKYVVNGNLGAFIYLKDSTGWPNQKYEPKLRAYKDIDLLKSLVNQMGIELVIYRIEDNLVSVESKAGRGLIQIKGDSLSYSVERTDPFNYDKLVNTDFSYGSYCQKDSTLLWSASSDYPGALLRVSQTMTQANSPDIIILSEDGYDLAKDYEAFVFNYKGGHGGLHRDLISVPFILSAKGMKAKQIDTMSSETFGQIILELLGISAFE